MVLISIFEFDRYIVGWLVGWYHGLNTEYFVASLKQGQEALTTKHIKGVGKVLGLIHLTKSDQISNHQILF